jgi:kinesin family member 11
MRKMTDSLVEQGSKEDLPTGSTPRKRVWQYTDSWELTKDRDTVIQGWKRRAAQSQDESDSDPESSYARQGRQDIDIDIPQSQLPPSGSLDLKQLPLPSVAVHPEHNSGPTDPLPPPYLEADPGQPPASNLSLLVAPAVVPNKVPPSAFSHPSIRAKIGKAGSDVVPAMGTLTERSTNLMYGRGTRKAR